MRTLKDHSPRHPAPLRVPSGSFLQRQKGDLCPQEIVHELAQLARQEWPDVALITALG